MEKEKLSADLKALVGENSLSERTWGDYLEHSVMPFIPSEEEKIGEYLGKHANVLKSINGQLNNEVATRVNDYKKSYKPEATHEPHTDPKPNSDNENKLGDLETRLRKFEEAESNKQAHERKVQKLADTKKQMQELGASHDTVLGLILPQLDVKDDATVADLAKQGKELYDKTYSQLYSDSYVPVHGGGASSGGNKADKEAYMKHLKETGRIKE